MQVECPVCDQTVSDCMSEKARVAHLRVCGRERGVAPQHLIGMLRAWQAAVETVAKEKGVVYVTCLHTPHVSIPLARHDKNG